MMDFLIHTGYLAGEHTWDTFQRNIIDLRSAQFESSFWYGCSGDVWDIRAFIRPFLLGTFFSYEVLSLGPHLVLFVSLSCASYMLLCWFMYQRAGKITRDMPQLQTGLGATARCMSRYIHPIRTIRERYTNWPKGFRIPHGHGTWGKVLYLI